MKIIINSQKIRTKMREKELNETQLAKKVGVTQQTISLILNDKTRGSLKTVDKICSVLDLDPREILSLGK